MVQALSVGKILNLAIHQALPERPTRHNTRRCKAVSFDPKAVETVWRIQDDNSHKQTGFAWRMKVAADRQLNGVPESNWSQLELASRARGFHPPEFEWRCCSYLSCPTSSCGRLPSLLLSIIASCMETGPRPVLAGESAPFAMGMSGPRSGSWE